MKKSMIAIILIVVLTIAFFSCTVITHENEYSLIKQFGKVSNIIETSGIAFRVPVLESVSKLPKQILLYDLAASDVITSDKKAMVVDSYVLWRIKDPLKFAQTLNSSVGNAESRLDNIVYNSLKTTISSQTQNDLILSRDGKLDTDVLIAVSEIMKEYGVEILSVETKRFDLPSDNKTAVFNRMISERNQIAASYVAEGNEESEKIKNSTNKEITILVSESQAQSETIRAEGEAEYMKILSEAYKTTDRKDFYEFIRSLDAIKIALKGNNKTIILPINSPLTSILLGE